MSLTTKISLGLVATLTSALDLATGTHPLSYPLVYDWESGTGLDQADKMWHDRRQLAASGSENHDLAGGLTDPFGAVITFARVKGLLVRADADNTNLVQVGGAASNQWVNWVANSSDIVNVRPGGVLILIAPDATGYAVTAGTGDQLKIANSAGSTVVDYDIVIVGASA